MLYHVTKVENARDIWESDRIVSNHLPKDRPKRHRMRERIDKLGNKAHSNWVNRVGSVFGWTTYDRAVRYCDRFREPAIVEFSTNGTVWAVQNFIVEDIYREYSDDVDDQFIWNLVNRAEVWNGTRDDELEAWLKPSSVDEISAVYDEFGDPLQLGA